MLIVKYLMMNKPVFAPIYSILSTCSILGVKQGLGKENTVSITMKSLSFINPRIFLSHNSRHTSFMLDTPRQHMYNRVLMPQIVTVWCEDLFTLIFFFICKSWTVVVHVHTANVEIKYFQRAKDKFRYCRLSPNHKFFHYDDCDEKTVPTVEELGKKISIVDIKTIVTGKECPHMKDKTR